jgi:alpha-tubulin suppressor-like RCC1 family protein
MKIRISTLILTLFFVQLKSYSQCWKDVSSYGSSSFLFGSDGSLWAIGDNSNGNFGNGTTLSSAEPIKINNSSLWKKIEMGPDWVIAIKNDGTLWSWGNNQYYTLGFWGSGIYKDPIQISQDNKWIDVFLGEYHTLGLKNDGTLWAWGSNQYGQCGTDAWGSYISNPSQIQSDNNWESIATSNQTSYGIKRDGTLWAWGKNDFGQVNDSSNVKIKLPVKVGNDNNWKSVKGGHDRVFAIKKDGSLWTWGKNTGGLLGLGNSIERVSITQIGNSTDWNKILSVGQECTFAKKNDQKIWGWGDNTNKLIDSLAPNLLPTPVQLSYPDNIVKMENKTRDTYFLNEKGEISLWGISKVKSISNGKKQYYFNQIGTQNNWTDISTNYSHSLALNSNNQLFVWGVSNSSHSLKGDGSLINVMKYPTLTVANDIYKFNANYSSTLIIKNDRTLWGWGNNQSFVLGANALGFPVLTQSGSSNQWKDVSSAYHHTLAIDNFGNLYSWGLNYNGECGQGNSNPAYANIIGNGFKVAKTGMRFSGAIKNDGSLWMWGINSEGQLGDGTTLNKNSLTRIGNENNWKDIMLGLNFTIALKEDGSLWAWGNNLGGTLGIGNVQGNYFTAPQRIGNDNNWKSISVGNSTLALKTDGSLWGWGPSFNGVLGNGSLSYYTYNPVRIGTDNDWNKVSIGNNVSLAIKNDGTLWSSGDNNYVGYDYFNTIPQNFSCNGLFSTPCSKYKYLDNTDYLNSNQTIQTSNSNGLIISREKIATGLVKSYNSPVTILKPGFEVEVGSVFKVEVNGCN